MAKVLNGLAAISDPQTAVRALKSNPDSKLIAQLRKAVGTMPDGKEKTQKEVADLLGISQSCISVPFKATASHVRQRKKRM